MSNDKHIPYVGPTERGTATPQCSCGWKAEGWWPNKITAWARALRHANTENAKNV